MLGQHGKSGHVDTLQGKNPGEREKTSLGTGELKSIRGQWVGKAVAPHSSTLAWKIPWMEELGRLKSMQRVGHD